jgi:hypothetical protein
MGQVIVIRQQRNNQGVGVTGEFTSIDALIGDYLPARVKRFPLVRIFAIAQLLRFSNNSQRLSAATFEGIAGIVPHA